jgi:hypothetical protein
MGKVQQYFDSLCSQCCNLAAKFKCSSLVSINCLQSKGVITPINRHDMTPELKSKFTSETLSISRGIKKNIALPINYLSIQMD